MPLGFGETATYQFYRTERWLGRLKAIHSGEYKPVGNWDDLLDYVLAFFLNCYHVKDWLINGPDWLTEVDGGVKRKAIEQFVTECDALRVCADLCNSTKHFRLSGAPRSGQTPTFRFQSTQFDCTTEPQVARTCYTLRTSRGDTDAYALAKECLESWRGFIREATPESLRVLAGRNSGTGHNRH